MTVAYSNNATSKLSASISNVATSLSVTSGHGARFPSLSAGIWFYLTLINSAGSNEIVKVTARSGDTMTIERAQDGTSALAFSVDDVVELRITKAMLDDFKTDAQFGYLTAATAASTYQPIGAYLTSINSGQVTTALGFTPYNGDSNPYGFITSASLTPYALAADLGSYLTTASAASTYLAKSGGTLAGGLTVTGDLLLAANSGGSRVVGFSGGTNTTLVLQAGAATGSGANLELTSSAFAFLDATETRIRSLDGATQFLALTSTATNVVTGALQQQGNQVLHAGNYFDYAIPSSGSPVINGSLTVTSTDPLFILKDNNNSGTAAGQRGWVSYQDSTGVERAAVGYTSASWTDFNITNSKGKVMIQGSEALTINNYSTTVTALNGFNATGSWPISVTGSAGFAGSASVATSLAGGVARSIPYQTSAGTTAMTPAGQAGQHLRVNAFGTGIEWVGEASMAVGSATVATKLSTASGTAPSYSARAWVNFNGTFGSSPFTIANGGIRAAGNVSSITDNGVGDYTVNFTTAMPDANYTWAGSAQLNSANVWLVGDPNGNVPSASALRFKAVQGNFTNVDTPYVYVAIFR